MVPCESELGLLYSHGLPTEPLYKFYLDMCVFLDACLYTPLNFRLDADKTGEIDTSFIEAKGFGFVKPDTGETCKGG